MARYNYGSKRGLKKKTLADDLRNQSGLGTAIGPTKPRKDRPGNVGQPISTSGATRSRSSNPQAKMSSYRLPPGPRGDSPSYGHGEGGREQDMRDAGPQSKRQIRRTARMRYRYVAPWRRQAQKLS